MLESIVGGFVFIIWAVLTIIVFVYIRNNTQTISLTGAMGFIDSWIDSLIASIVIAGAILGIGYLILSWGWELLKAYWKIIGGIVIILGLLCFYGSKKDDEKDEKVMGTRMDSDSIAQKNKATEKVSEGQPESKLEAKVSDSCKCPYCGEPVNSENVFCGNCGKRLR